MTKTEIVDHIIEIEAMIDDNKTEVTNLFDIQDDLADQLNMKTYTVLV